MSDYFHERMVAKMVSSNGYQQGYSVGFLSGYNQGRADAIEEILLLPKHNHYDNYGELMCQSIDVKDIEQVKGQNNG